MTSMIINLLCKTFLSIIDIWLLNFYLKSSYPNIYQEKFKKVCLFIYCIIFLSFIMFAKTIPCLIVNILTSMVLTIIFLYYHVSITNFLLKLCHYYIIKIIIFILIFFTFSWVFNTKLSIIYINYTVSYTLFIQILERYFLYLTFIIIFKRRSQFHYFKILSIITLAYFGLTVTLDNPALFHSISVGRTFIFTILISIIALICFDRYQTRYEAEKRKQEIMLQNLQREKVYNEQLEKQFKEIRKIRHNLNNIFLMVHSHILDGEYEKADHYLCQSIKGTLEKFDSSIHTGMSCIDGVMNAKISLMKDKNIHYHEDIAKILQIGCIDPHDLALIIGLAMDNAIEAAEKVDGERKIELTLHNKQSHLIFHLSNSIPYGSHPIFHKTSKLINPARHGFGVMTIQEVTQQYNGDVKYQIEDNRVTLRVVLEM